MNTHWKWACALIVLFCVAPAQAARSTRVPVKYEGWRITYGTPTAKVVVKAFFPIGETGGAHNWVKTYAKALLAAYPKQVRVVVYDFTSPKGGEAWQQAGLTCGAFLINNKMQATVGGKPVTFSKNPEVSGWTLAQLKDAVGQAVRAAYGKGAAPAPKPAAGATSLPAAGSVSGVMVVAVPCGLAGPYGEIARMFQARYPRVRLQPSVSGLVAMRNELRAGKMKADVYLALGTADIAGPQESSHLVAGSLVRCARVPLAVVVPRGNPDGVRKVADLASAQVKSVVTYEPGLAGGRAARKALESAGVWNKVAAKTNTPKIPDQCKQLLKMGKADAAIVYRTCLMESYEVGKPAVRDDSIALALTIPQETYDPVEVGAAMVKGCRAPAGARALLQFLATPEARKVWKKWDFEEPAAKPAPSKSPAPKPSPSPSAAKVPGQGTMCAIPRPKGGLLILCGAGLRAPMELLRKEFESRHHVPVRVIYAGSQCLLAQIAITYRTRPCDLYMPGEEFYAAEARKRGYVDEYRPVCLFVPVVMVRKGNPKGIRALKDLAKPGVRVGLGEAKTCAVGKTSLDLLKKNGLTTAVQRNVRMHTAMAPELGNAVKLGSLDAAINWDAVAAAYQDGADIVPIPPAQNIVVRATLGLLRCAPDRALARRFYNFATGSEGREIFRKARYTVDPARPVFPYQARK